MDKEFMLAKLSRWITILIYIQFYIFFFIINYWQCSFLILLGALFIFSSPFLVGFSLKFTANKILLCLANCCVLIWPCRNRCRKVAFDSRKHLQLLFNFIIYNLHPTFFLKWWLYILTFWFRWNDHSLLLDLGMNMMMHGWPT